MDTFDALPLAAIMNKQFICTHGGLSPEIESIEDINKIDRYREPPARGPMCDLLWADPMEEFDPEMCGGQPYRNQFTPNEVRGCSYYFTFNSALHFLEKNRILSLIRAHEAQAAGYRMHRRNDKTGFPTVITLFSAPNYLDLHGNKGAILRYENNVFNIRQFNSTPHPYYLPGFMNVFNWSLPFVSEKVAELLLTVFNLVDDVAADREEEEFRRREVIRRKVMTVSRLLNLYKKMRDAREALVVAGSLSPDGSVLPDTLAQKPSEAEQKEHVEHAETVKKTLKDSLGEDQFLGARQLDRPNEARPPDTQAPPTEANPGRNRLIMSRDKILLSKRNSLPKSHNEIMKDAPKEAPKIKEEQLLDG